MKMLRIGSYCLAEGLSSNFPVVAWWLLQEFPVVGSGNKHEDNFCFRVILNLLLLLFWWFELSGTSIFSAEFPFELLLSTVSNGNVGAWFTALGGSFLKIKVSKLVCNHIKIHMWNPISYTGADAGFLQDGCRICGSDSNISLLQTII